MNKKYYIKDSHKIYDGRFIIYRTKFTYQKFSGEMSNEHEFEIFSRKQCVAATLPYNPYTQEIILVEQIRAGAFNTDFDPWMLEIIAGMQEPTEAIETTAIRETKEEANCNITKLARITDYFSSPGGTNELVHLFCGKFEENYQPGIFGCKHEQEDIKTHLFKISEVPKLLQDNKIYNAATLIALQWLLLNQQKIHKEFL